MGRNASCAQRVGDVVERVAVPQVYSWLTHLPSTTAVLPWGPLALLAEPSPIEV